MRNEGQPVTPCLPHPPRAVALLAALLLPALLVGCSADQPDTRDAARPKPSTSGVPSPAPANIEKIASLTGCEAEIRMEADELREGVCKTSRGNWIVTTFPAEKFKRTWLDTASMYGGTYLVGPKWAIGAKPGVLKQLRTKVGGELQQLRSINDPAPATGSPAG
nr:hypothetical protein OH820_32935 [Streptomyces sp. NBC_00857]